MRKFILIAATVLLSASAQAGVSRGLTLASSEEPVVAAPKTVDTPNAVEVPKAVEAPKSVERPAIVDTTSDQPKADSPKPAPDKNAEKPKHKRESTEARVIYELHRHGIYW
jgi:hypothetical protein